MTPQELLAKAADEIARTGHCKASYSEPGIDERVAPVCAYGAMARAVSDGKTTCYADLGSHAKTWSQYRLIEHAAELLAAEIGNELDSPFGAITRFNDDDRTTGEDVILAMKTAAAGG